MLSVLFVVLMSLVKGRYGSTASSASDCSCYTFDSSGFGLLSKKHCTRGGELASLETIWEWEFIKTQIMNRTNEYDNEWWIGLEKRDEEWKWLSNNSLTYDKWQPKEPSNGSVPEDCVVIAKNYPPDTYGLFNNAPCQMWKGLICEYKIKGTNCSDDAHVRWCEETTRLTPTQPAKTLKATMTLPSTLKTKRINHKERTMVASEHPKTQNEYTETIMGQDNIATTKKPFPDFTMIVIGVLVPTVVVLLCCIVLCVCRRQLNRRRENPKRTAKHKDTNTENCTVDVQPGSSSLPVDQQEMKAIDNQPTHACVLEGSHLDNSNGIKDFTPNSDDCLISPVIQDDLELCDNINVTSVEATSKGSNQNKTDTGIGKDIRKFPQEHLDDAVPVIYAKIDEGKEEKATKVVYAEVHKSSKKQEDHREMEVVTYAEVADLNLAAGSVPKPPPPYHSTEYASVCLTQHSHV